MQSISINTISKGKENKCMHLSAYITTGHVPYSMSDMLHLPDTDAETMWEEVKTVFSENSKKILGCGKVKVTNPRISEEVTNLVNERNKPT